MHTTNHELAGKTVVLKVKNLHIPLSDELMDHEYRIENWWDLLTGGSWMYAEGNPAALKYAMRSGVSMLPLDDEVVYGKVGGYGHLIHVSELGEVL